MPTRQHEFIADGRRRPAGRLAVRPRRRRPWPAVLEALPYRKDDDTSAYRPEYERLADAGYVVCRVDLRGTGSSEGIAEDEYPAVERTDMMTVIDWLATQDVVDRATSACTGRATRASTRSSSRWSARRR